MMIRESGDRTSRDPSRGRRGRARAEVKPMTSIVSSRVRVRSVRRGVVYGLSSLFFLSGGFLACTGDDDVFKGGPTDNVDAGGPRDGAGGDGSGGDGASPPVCGDAAGAPQRALLVQGLPKTSEVSAVNLQTGAVDGRL